MRCHTKSEETREFCGTMKHLKGLARHLTLKEDVMERKNSHTSHLVTTVRLYFLAEWGAFVGCFL